jgi:hypothetical protein
MLNGVRVAALLLALPGVVVLFLPFTENRSPLDALHEGSFALLGAPFFLAIPIVIWQARKLIGRRVSSIEVAAAYVLSVGSMLSVLVFAALLSLGLKASDVDDLQGFLTTLAILGPPFLFALTNVLVLRNLGKRMTRDCGVEIFIIGAYFPNAIFCLVEFSTGIFHLDVGGHLAFVACVAYVITIVLTLWSSKRRSSNPVYSI